jgi:hypothetical protein
VWLSAIPTSHGAPHPVDTVPAGKTRPEALQVP